MAHPDAPSVGIQEGRWHARMCQRPPGGAVVFHIVGCDRRRTDNKKEVMPIRRTDTTHVNYSV